MDLTPDDVQDILQALDGTPFGELSLETSRYKLLLRRTASGEWTTATEVPVADGESAAVPDQPHSAEQAVEPSPDGGLLDIASPLLGTFYRAPRPGAPPFVDVGSTVEPDTVVCIIETMKLMNSVTAGVSGTVEQILVTNGQFAPQGSVLMRVRPGEGP